jgi:hypothetical protein
MSIGKIIGIFICVFLLFSCNKNNKAQNGNFENESVYDNASTEEQADNNETTIANNSDEDLEYDDSKYDDSENDTNSPYSDFFYVWTRYEKDLTSDPYGEDSYTCRYFMTITGKSIKSSSYEKLYWGYNWSDFSRNYTYKYIIENTVWEPITSQEVNNKYRKMFYDNIENFPTGYKITGKPRGIEGTELPDNPAHTSYSASPNYNIVSFVFLHKDDPSIMLSFNYFFDDSRSSMNSAFEYHRIDR